MSDLTIKHRAAAVRKTWSYGEKVQRALAAQQRCARLFSQLGLAPQRMELAFAHPVNRGGRRLG
ncbi:MAG TPA: hypothetical protein VEQ85_08635 [Lacipirellulaceae bacterium]|nr:hypothetical protein [Lacipirellulaceae bacterium]